MNDEHLIIPSTLGGWRHWVPSLAWPSKSSATVSTSQRAPRDCTDESEGGHVPEEPRREHEHQAQLSPPDGDLEWATFAPETGLASACGGGRTCSLWGGGGLGPRRQCKPTEATPHMRGCLWRLVSLVTSCYDGHLSFLSLFVFHQNWG